MEKDRSTEQRILDAAKRIFINKGMAGARMQDIANEAGINKALLHYYFRNKETLFETIFEEAVHRFIPRVNDIFEMEAPLFEKITMFCSEYISKLQENPFIPVFIINELHRQPDVFINRIFGNRKPNVAKFAMQIQDSIRDGVIKPIHPMQLVMNMISLCVFPFLSKPMIQRLAFVPDPLFQQLMEERKTEVPKFIIESIKKQV